MRARATYHIVPLLLFACGPATGPSQAPVLEFPEAGVDDPEAYEGYATRFFRDSRGNTFQIYLDGRAGRVVHVWADAANESAAFSVRDPAGRPVPLSWDGFGAEAASADGRRSVRHRLAAAAATIDIGGFVLGTMRQERDYQYLERHLAPFGDPPFVLPELTAFVESLGRLPEGERARHLELLDAADVAELEGRLVPRVTLAEEGTSWRVRIGHSSLDGRNRLSIELAGDGGSTATLSDGLVSVEAASGESIVLDVTVSTDSPPLTPLGRDRLFNATFEDYLAGRRRAADSLRGTLTEEVAARDPRLAAFRRLERQALGLELLSAEEKLIASMPNYATYFGRDQMISALMFEPISSPDLQELVIASVLGKLGPDGDVSHEEALGGQAIREAAAEYAALVEAWEADRSRDAAAAAAHLERARALLGNLQAVRENYRMIDDDFQLPVLVARWLVRPDVPAERARAFLAAPVRPGNAGPRPARPGSQAGRVTRLEALASNLARVARLTGPFAERPSPERLVGFAHRDAQGWLPGSWRDSRAGYGNGRYAMDVNAVWVPAALDALATILDATDALGLSVSAAAGTSGDAAALRAYADDRETLRAAIATWRGARRLFGMAVDPPEIRRAVDAHLAALPEAERVYWRTRLDTAGASVWSRFVFPALALDSAGRPVSAPNTDIGTDLFLGDHAARVASGAVSDRDALAHLDALARPYPVGLLVAGLGPVVVNDVYASADVRRRFRDDLYHSPRVVWGREVNLILLGLARQIRAAYGDATGPAGAEMPADARDRPPADAGAARAYADSLRGILDAVRRAVEASGLAHNELWSYEIEPDGLRPVRYGQSSDIQLWNVTDLAVDFALDRLPPP